MQTSASRHKFGVPFRCCTQANFRRRSKIMGKGDNRQKNDKKNKKQKKDAKKPAIPGIVKKA